ncbi:MAG: NADPH-dependent FMN reductase [Cyclobacteriaceae bacterium]|jgi:NAD(P)H-dependent FMN reductase
MRKLKVLAISGSTRKNSSNENILKGIGTVYSDQVELNLFDGVDKLPHFNPDIDNDNLPEAVGSFRKQISEADGILFCTPEYVFSIPGSLKNAIEWNVSTTLFTSKPVAIIVASASGEKTFESLKLVMTTIESTIGPHSTLLIKGAKGKVRDGVIHEETLEDLRILMDDFIETMKKPVNTPTKYN